MPSDIVFFNFIICFIFFPFPTNNPVVKFLDKMLLHVRVKSPSPDNP